MDDSLERLTGAYDRYGSLVIVEVANAGRSVKTRATGKRKQVQRLRTYLDNYGFSNPLVLGGLFLIKAPAPIHLTPNIDFIVELPSYDRVVAKYLLKTIRRRDNDRIDYKKIGRRFLKFKRQVIPGRTWTEMLSPNEKLEKELNLLWKRTYGSVRELSYSFLLPQLKGAFLEEYAREILQGAQKIAAPEVDPVWVMNPWVQRPETYRNNDDKALYREGDLVIGIPHSAFYRIISQVGREHPASIDICPTMRDRAKRLEHQLVA